MIDYVKGTVEELTPTYAVIDCCGTGYRCEISLPTFTAIEGKSQIKLLVHESIREDAWTLYGFNDERERGLFRLLIGVSGVGAGTARMILSALSAPELEAAIMNGDHLRLKAVKGIGAKTAQRIIVDLKDKVKPSGDDIMPTAPGIETTPTAAYEEALAALVMLGFPRTQADKVLKKLYGADPTLKVETAIKQALAIL